MGEPRPSQQTLRALDAVNFLMADVETGVGPFLAIYLATSRHWDAAQIGLAMSVAGIANIIVQTPAGAIVDKLRHKREAIAIGALLVALASLAILASKGFAGVVSMQSVLGIVGAFFPPAMAGMTLGIVGKVGLTRGTGRFNFTLGVIATATGLGASLSNGIAGSIAKHAGFNTAFLFLAAVAATGFCIFLFAMPETKEN